MLQVFWENHSCRVSKQQYTDLGGQKPFWRIVGSKSHFENKKNVLKNIAVNILDYKY